jgi:hypothetical protein
MVALYPLDIYTLMWFYGERATLKQRLLIIFLWDVKRKPGVARDQRLLGHTYLGYSRDDCIDPEGYRQS